MTDGPAPSAFRPGRRFARVGRVLPIALVQIVGTLVAARASGVPARAPWSHGGLDAWSTSSGAVSGSTSFGVLAVVLLVAGVVVLPFRWRWPVVVLGIVLATTVGFALTTSARGPFVAALTMALVNAWMRGARVQAAVAGAIAFLALPWADVLTVRSAAIPTVSMTLAAAWLVATMALSELARVRVLRAAETRRARAEEERRRAGDERVRIARELHDSVAHAMSLINLQSGVALHLGASGSELPEQTRTALTTIRDASRDALVELRSILGVLRAVDQPDGATDGGERSPVPGLSRLPDLVDRARAAGLDVELRMSGVVDCLDGSVDRSAFRIAQESVTNVMKHAPAHRAVVDVRADDDLVTIRVTDAPDDSTARSTGIESAGIESAGIESAGMESAGMESARARSPGIGSTGIGATGNGIIGMRERAEAVGGELRVGPLPDGSWRVEARLPRGAGPATPSGDEPAARSGTARATPSGVDQEEQE